MRTLYYCREDESHEYSIVDCPIPKLKDDYVMIRTLCSSIERDMFTEFKSDLSPHEKHSIGHEICGTILEFGGNAESQNYCTDLRDDLHLGQRVFGFIPEGQACSEFCVVHKDLLFASIPGLKDTELVTIVQTYLMAYHLCCDIEGTLTAAKQGDTVLLFSTNGALGASISILLKHLLSENIKIIEVPSDAIFERSIISDKQPETKSHKKNADKQFYVTTIRSSSGKVLDSGIEPYVDIVYDPFGISHVNNYLSLVREGGRIVVYEPVDEISRNEVFSAKGADINLLLQNMGQRNISLHCSSFYNLSLETRRMLHQRFRASNILSLIKDRILKLPETEVVSMTDEGIASAFKMVKKYPNIQKVIFLTTTAGDAVRELELELEFLRKRSGFK